VVVVGRVYFEWFTDRVWVKVGNFNGLGILAGRLRFDDKGVYPLTGGLSLFNFGISLPLKSTFLPKGLPIVNNDYYFLRMFALISF
jgi:hypothetical protein